MTAMERGSQCLMQSMVVLQLEVDSDTLPRVGDVLVSFEVDLLYMRLRQPIDEDVIGKAAAAVHADGIPHGRPARR
jgi:hypothetical protein